MLTRSAERDHVVVRPTTPVLWVLAVLAMLGASGSIALAVVGGIPPIHAVLIVWVSLSYIVSGLIAWSHRPDAGIGPLMIIAGLSTLSASTVWASNPALHTFGQAVDLLPLVLIVHVFLAFPLGNLGRRFERALMASGYFAAICLQLAVMMLGGLGGDAHLLGLVEQPGLANALHNVELIVISAVALVSVGVLAIRRKADGPPLRRSLTVLIDSCALGLVAIAALLLVGVLGGPSFPIIQRISLALVGLAPVAFLAGLLNARLARTAIGNLVMELRAEPDDLRAPLARALRDPSLSLMYWLPQFGSWAGPDGKPTTPPTDSGRATTLIDRDGRHIAAIVHDPALNEETELLDAVSAAAAIALENGRLQAELRANLDELRESRARVIEAGQKERQRLERDLHDGAQQRLVALSLELGVLETHVDDDAKALLSQARSEIAVSLAELRDVARGLHPAVLTAHGLGVALESLAARAPVPVRLTVDVMGRVAEAVEVAAYFVVCECLANIGKHAHASSATVDVVRTDGQLVVEVVDDGRGGADTERGTGLRGLADRVEALGGRLRVWTPRGGGTTVKAELPCG